MAAALGGTRRPPEYLSDNKKVYDILSEIYRDTPSWEYIQPSSRSRDGRGAWLSLYDTYLGPNNAQTLAAECEAEMSKLKYTGEKRRFNFNKYVDAHVRLHNVMNDLKIHGYSGMDEAQRVRKFLAGIQCKEVEVIRAQCWSSSTLRASFKDTVIAFKEYIANTGLSIVETDSAVVGATEATTKPSEDDSDVHVELRHHTREEYMKLTGPQKLKLKRWRETQPDRAAATHPEQLTAKTVAAMIAAALKPAVKKSDPKGTKKKAASNRTNKALIKQVKTKPAEDDVDDDDDDNGSQE
jgi:hypothetical protein